MLEFMVLGQIPGTQIQFNFSDVLLASAWMLVFIETFIIIRRYRRIMSQAKAQRGKPTGKSPSKNSPATKKTTQKSHKNALKALPGSA